MELQTILFERRGGVAIITMNRPNRFNAMNSVLGEELIQVLELCREDETIRAVILTGAGTAFSAGADLNDFKEAVGTPNQINPIRYLTKVLNRIIMDIRLLPKPVIAAINGPVGGGGLCFALACDLRVAADTANFKLSYTSIGLNPDGAFTLLAGAVVGLGKLNELIFLDPRLDAHQALEYGLLHKVVSAEELSAAALNWAEKLAAGATMAYARTKAMANEAMLPNLEKILELERQAIMASSKTSDYVEGITAFVEKRRPVYQGK